MRGSLIGTIRECDLPRRCCARCDHFGIDAEPRHHLIDGRFVEGWISRCDFDPSVTGAEHVCGRFEDRDAAQAARRRERFGYDRPSVPVAGCEQDDLFAISGPAGAGARSAAG